MHPGLVGIYLAMCLLCGFAARKTGLRFWGGFFMSILVTPLAGLAFILFLRFLQDRKTRRTVICPLAAQMAAEEAAAQAAPPEDEPAEKD